MNDLSTGIRIVVADDHPVVAAGVKTVLEDCSELRVVGLAGTGHEAIAQCRALQPHVLMLDLRLPDLPGAEVCRRVKADFPGIRVVVLTSYGDDANVLTALTSGADGYLLKHVAGTNIAEAVLQVARGGQVLDPAVARVVVREMTRQGPGDNGAKSGGLTEADHAILRRVAAGRRNKEIGVELGMAEKTVRNQLTRIFAKLGVNSRIAAAAAYHATERPDGGEVG